MKVPFKANVERIFNGALPARLRGRITVIWTFFGQTHAARPLIIYKVILKHQDKETNQ